MSIKIRPSTASDVFQIREVQKQTWLDVYPNPEAGITYDDIQAKFDQDDTLEGREKIAAKKDKYYQDKNICIWTAVSQNSLQQDQIVGFVMGIKKKQFNRIAAIYVLPLFQRQGIGSRLIQAVMDWLDQDKEIFVNVVSYNRSAISFYKKFGFKSTGRSGVLDEAARLLSGKLLPEIEMVRITEEN